MTELLCIETAQTTKSCIAGLTYTAKDEFICSCGCVSVDIGDRLPREYTGCHCYCNAELPRNGNVWLDKYKFFREIGTIDECEQYGELVTIDK